MAGRNGYFKLDMRDSGVFLITYPPEEGGLPIELKEIMAYIEAKSYDKFDLKELNRAVNITEGMGEVYIGEWQGIYENESMGVTVSSDKMLVFCRFFPPSNQGKLLTEKDIISELEFQKINVGIIPEEIQKFLKERYYCTNYVMAKGIPPIHGEDAKIEYFFNTNPNLKPKRNPDGTVNYHDLNTISRIEKGQILAKLHPGTQGKSGKDVFGGDISARQEKVLKLEYANNISVSEDKTEITSDVTGHVSLVNGKVFVSDIFEVPADVDNATGDIVYDGNVSIKGNVKSGFSVRAKGNIEVEGVVEAAFLSAGGQVIVKRGIHGMTKGSVEAKGNIIAQFIENATVTAGGFVEAGSILHSKVFAGTEVRVNGRKGFATGGLIRAGNMVEAQTIGSEMGTAMKIEVGVDPEMKERYSELQKKILTLSKEMEKIKPALINYSEKVARKEPVNPERVQQIQILAKNFKEMQLQIKEMREEFSEIHEQIQKGTSARVKVNGTIYPGVSISISDVSMNIKSPTSFSKFVKEQGEIVTRPL